VEKAKLELLERKHYSQTILPDKLKEKIFPVVLKVFSSNDFHQVTMRQIIELSGVSGSTLYKYFFTKEDLLFFTLEEKIANIHHNIVIHVAGLKSGKEILRKILWATMDYYDNNPEVAVTAFITVPMGTWMKQESFPGVPLKKIFVRILAELKEQKLIDNIIDLRLFQDLYYMICYRYIYTWYYFGMKWKLVDAVYKDFDVLWKLFRSEAETMVG